MLSLNSWYVAYLIFPEILFSLSHDPCVLRKKTFIGEL